MTCQNLSSRISGILTFANGRRPDTRPTRRRISENCGDSFLASQFPGIGLRFGAKSASLPKVTEEPNNHAQPSAWVAAAYHLIPKARSVHLTLVNCDVSAGLAQGIGSPTASPFRRHLYSRFHAYLPCAGAVRLSRPANHPQPRIDS